MFLPLFSFSPEEIFSGDILLFDVDFFNPQKEVYARTEITTTSISTTTIVTDTTVTSMPSTSTTTSEGRSILITDDLDLQEELDHSDEASSTIDPLLGTTTTTSVEENIKYYYYLEDPSLGDTEDNRVITSRQNTALDLQPLISQWYSAIRNIAIVLSMSVLLYIGIRMLLSSVGQEKAKYRQMLIDWVVGICLLFFMHYIMVFSVTIVQSFNDIISTTKEDTVGQAILLEDDEEGYISEKLKAIGMSEFVDESTDPAQILWTTNLMGALRLKAQVSYGDMAFVGYGICYVILVLFTVYFTFVYLRRVLYMAFLTMIAPLVALTYPIDKINDGQAQGFNRWLKEYIFNLLLQPLHLLLYTILVTSAYELASTNVVYSLVAIGFMIPAEKLMRSLFGFEKANTPGSVAGAAAGAAMLNSGLQRILRRPPGGKSGDKNKGDSSDDQAPTRIGYNSNFDPMDAMAAENNENNNGDSDTRTRTIGEGETSESDDTSTRRIDAGGPSASDASLYNNEDPRRRMEREALQEKIADGQLSEDELTDEQKRLVGILPPNDDNENNPNDNGRIDNQNNTSDTARIDNGNNTSDTARIDNRNNRSDTARIDSGENNNAQEGRTQNPPNSQITSRQGTSRQITGSRGRTTKMTNKEALQGLGRVAKYTAKQGGRKLAKTAPKAVRTAAKIAAGAAVGLTAGVAGATIGIATGDFSNTLTFAAGAATAGGALGASRINTNPPRGKSAEQIARERAYWGDKYNDHIAEENMKKWKKDSDKKAKLESL